MNMSMNQCDFRFNLFVSFSFGFSFVLEDVLMICLNTVHRKSRIQRPTAVAPVLYCMLFSAVNVCGSLTSYQHN